MAYQSTTPPIAEIQLVSIQGCWQRLWHDACFLLLLSGEVQVEVEEHVSYLNSNGILLVEPDTPFQITGHGSNLLMLIRMDYDFFAQGRVGQHGRLVCNSAEDPQRDYSLLRQMLSHLALNYYEQSDCRELRQLEQCYALLYYLNTTHYIPGDPLLAGNLSQEKRGRQILSYLENNYMHEIHLEDLARTAYLSPSYLSRLFKKLTGMNFKAYLDELRLRHAVEDLQRSEQTITSIAYNNGFPNVSALNNAIRKKYKMAPNEFRRSLEHVALPVTEEPPYELVEYDNVRENLEILAGPEPAKALGIYRYPDQLAYQVEDVGQFRPIRPIWKTMINIGTLKSLANINIKSQLSMLQEDMGFRYARIESILTDESIPVLPNGQYNFSYFDRAIEMLLSLKLTPFLDLSSKEDYLFLSRSEIIYRGDQPHHPTSEEAYLDKVSALIRHCINTFGAGVVETWGVEIRSLHDEYLAPTERPADFCRRFIAVYHMIRQWLPHMRIGGPEHNLAMDRQFVKEVAVMLKQAGVKPDFLSLCAMPYEPTRSEDNSVKFVISSNPDYLRDSIQELRSALYNLFGDVIPIWLTVFGPDIRTRNHVNDSCYQASFLTKNTIDLIDLVDVIGYWQLSDVGTEYLDTTRILFGGTGLLSKDGLKKPGYTALKRLAGISSLLIERSGNMLMTTNGINTYNIVLHNYAHLNDLYCLSNGEGVHYDNVYTMFHNAATRDISIRLGGLVNGRYKVITTTLNREHGSLFDEWLRYGILDELQPHDIHYLQDIVHPHRAVRYQDCVDGTLQLDLQMLPHEVKFLILLREL